MRATTAVPTDDEQRRPGERRLRGDPAAPRGDCCSRRSAAVSGPPTSRGPHRSRSAPVTAGPARPRSPSIRSPRAHRPRPDAARRRPRPGEPYAFCCSACRTPSGPAAPLPQPLAMIGVPSCPCSRASNSARRRASRPTEPQLDRTLPGDRALLGAEIFLKCVAPDPTANALNLAMSAGLRDPRLVTSSSPIHRGVSPAGAGEDRRRALRDGRRHLHRRGAPGRRRATHDLGDRGDRVRDRAARPRPPRVLRDALQVHGSRCW